MLKVVGFRAVLFDWPLQSSHVPFGMKPQLLASLGYCSCFWHRMVMEHWYYCKKSLALLTTSGLLWRMGPQWQNLASFEAAKTSVGPGPKWGKVLNFHGKMFTGGERREEGWKQQDDFSPFPPLMDSSKAWCYYIAWPKTSLWMCLFMKQARLIMYHLHLFSLFPNPPHISHSFVTFVIASGFVF